MTAYPVQLEITSPPRFERIQLIVRLAIAIFLGWIGISLGWLTMVLFFALPVFAAILVPARGPDGYLQNTSARVWPYATWLFAFGAYMLLVTDHVPVDRVTPVRSELHPTGRPTIGSAVLRLLTSIPSAFVWCLLGIVSWLLCVFSYFTVLFSRKVPESIVAFQTGYLRWGARLFAYHASFVEEYPPFSLSDHPSVTSTSAVAP